MSLHDALRDACREVGILPPRAELRPGRWTQTDTLERNGRGDGRVLLHDDGMGGIAWNHQTGQHVRWRDGDAARLDPAAAEAERARASRRAAEKGRRAAEVAAACDALVRACRQDKHPYLARKGFPDEIGMIHEGAHPLIPAGLPAEPLLVVPGRIGGKVSTVQFIAADGTKKNAAGARLGGAFHRIATGRETWVCEGIATALSVRAALRLLGRSATVLCAFDAGNVARVARDIPGAVIAADNDKPLDQFGGLGTGEHYARQSGRTWAMPAERGDWNDMHQREGLRAVALALREVRP